MPRTSVALRDYFVEQRICPSSAANVSRLEIEAAHNALPGVKLAMLITLPDEAYGKLVAAAEVPKDGALVHAKVLRQARRVDAFKLQNDTPYSVVSKTDIPRTVAGKLSLPGTSNIPRRSIAVPSGLVRNGVWGTCKPRRNPPQPPAVPPTKLKYRAVHNHPLSPKYFCPCTLGHQEVRGVCSQTYVCHMKTFAPWGMRIFMPSRRGQIVWAGQVQERRLLMSSKSLFGASSSASILVVIIAIV